MKRRSFISGLFASAIAFFTPFSQREKVVAREIVEKDYRSHLPTTRREQNKFVSILKRNRYSKHNVLSIIQENRYLQQFNISLDQIRYLTLEERKALVTETDWNIIEPILYKVMNRPIPNKPDRLNRKPPQEFPEEEGRNYTTKQAMSISRERINRFEDDIV